MEGQLDKHLQAARAWYARDDEATWFKAPQELGAEYRYLLESSVHPEILAVLNIEVFAREATQWDTHALHRVHGRFTLAGVPFRLRYEPGAGDLVPMLPWTLTIYFRGFAIDDMLSKEELQHRLVLLWDDSRSW